MTGPTEPGPRSPRVRRVDDGRKRPVTAVDVADYAGVSQSAVSRAFTPDRSISPAMRAKVLRAARELGYRPNLIARSLRTRRSGVIGVAMAYLENQFYPQVLEELSTRLQSAGFRLLLFTTDHGRAADPLLEDILHYHVDALVLAATSLSSELAEECSDAGVPVVLFNRTSDVASVSTVTGDNVDGARQIAAFLVAGGHRRIAYVAGLEDSSTNRDREDSFVAQLRACGQELFARAVGHYSFEKAAAAARTLMSMRPRPDAIFCANDHMALSLIQTLRCELGLRVPEDVSVVGFDDVGPARWPSFRLTTYSQPVPRMLDALIAILLQAVKDPATPPQRVVVPGSLVVRDTARLPPAGLVVCDGERLWRPEASASLESSALESA